MSIFSGTFREALQNHEAPVAPHCDEARELKPGNAVLLEDTTGKGHISEVTSTIDFEGIAIRL